MRVPVDAPRVRDYVWMVVRAWPFILVVTLLSAGAALVAVHQRPATYSASALAFATVAGDPSTFSQYYGGMGARVRMPSYVELAKSRSVAERAIDAIDSTVTPEDLSSRVWAAWVPDGVDLRGRPSSALLRITVTSDDPDEAVREVNAVGGTLVELSKELEWYESAPTDDIHYTGAVAELLPIGAATTAHKDVTPVLEPVSMGAGVGLAVGVVIMLGVGIGRDTLMTRGQLDHVAKLAKRPNT